MVTSGLRDGPRPPSVSRRTDALVADVGKHHRAISAHQQRLLADVAELDRRKAWRVDGATSMVAWLVQRCGVTAATARDWVTVAVKLEALPKISDALAQGKLSFDQVKPLVDVANPETDERRAKEAPHWSAKQVRELAIANRNQSDEQAAGGYFRRFLRFNDQRRSFAGALSDDQYALVKGTLFRRAGALKRTGTTFDQRMADALTELCRGGGPSGDGEGVRPTVVVHADLTLLAGGAGTAELDTLARSPLRSCAAWPATPRSWCRATTPKAKAFNRAVPAGVRAMRNVARCGGVTKDVAFRGARTRSSPMCTMWCTGSTAARPTFPIWSSCAINITAACTSWVGRCRVMPTSN
jgi:hypothetical protein